MLTELVSRALCLFLVWPVLVLRWGLPARSPARRPAGRPLARQWGAIAPIGGRVVAVRLQVVWA